MTTLLLWWLWCVEWWCGLSESVFCAIVSGLVASPFHLHISGLLISARLLRASQPSEGGTWLYSVLLLLAVGDLVEGDVCWMWWLEPHINTVCLGASWTVLVVTGEKCCCDMWWGLSVCSICEESAFISSIFGVIKPLFTGEDEWFEGIPSTGGCFAIFPQCFMSSGVLITCTGWIIPDEGLTEYGHDTSRHFVEFATTYPREPENGLSKLKKKWLK